MMSDARALRSRDMPGKGKTDAADDQERDALFKLSLVEAFADPQVQAALAKALKSANVELTQSVASLRQEVQSLKTAVQQRDAAISQLQQEVRQLQLQNDTLEQYGRRNNLRIKGIPETEEDTDVAVMKLGNEVLQLDPPLEPRDIESSHRLPPRHGAKPAEPRAVIVRFRIRKDRTRFISARKMLQPLNQSVDTEMRRYINEDLTMYRSKLYGVARQLQRTGAVEKVWTYNGTIKIKLRSGHVKSIAAIEDLRKALPEVDPARIVLPAYTD